MIAVPDVPAALSTVVAIHPHTGNRRAQSVGFRFSPAA
jgi:hypothetical protein